MARNTRRPLTMPLTVAIADAIRGTGARVVDRFTEPDQHKDEAGEPEQPSTKELALGPHLPAGRPAP